MLMGQLSADTTATQKTPDEVAWYDILGQFKKKASEFDALYKKLSSQRALVKSDPSLYQEYTDKMNSAESLRNDITYIRDKTAAFMDWFENSSWSPLNWFNGANQQQLGFLPALIPIAVVVASTAAIGKWVSDAYIFSKKLDKVAELQKSGMSAKAATATVNQLDTSGSILSSLFGSTPKMLLIAGVGVLAAPYLFRVAKELMSNDG